MVTQQARDYHSFVGQLGVSDDLNRGSMEYEHAINIITLNNNNSNNNPTTNNNCGSHNYTNSYFNYKSRCNSVDSSDDDTSSQPNIPNYNTTTINTNTNNHNNNNNSAVSRTTDFGVVEGHLYHDRVKNYCDGDTFDCLSAHNKGNICDLNASDIRSLGLPVNGFKDIVLFYNDDFVAICANFIKLYSTSGDLLHKIELPAIPISLCRVGDHRVAVTCSSRLLCLVAVHSDDSGNNDNVYSRRTLVLEQELNTAIQYCSVAQLSSSELIAVGLDSPVLHRLLYKPTHLEVLCSLSLEQVGKLNVRHQRSYRMVCVSAAKQILISDRMNNFLLSLSTAGTWKIAFFYKPQGLVVAGSYFYVIQGGGLNLVYRFRLNGLDPYPLLRKEHDLLDPWGMSINRNKKLVITCNTSDCPTVRVFT
ncbi:hypothetical protein Ahia01_001347800 [Argonauta hians]